MEQHAVPQDITGFKFKLVGDMTLKQFGELAGGAVVAYLFFASGWHPFIRWPLVFLFGFLGFALAFLPIEERPLDIWIINFIRAIYQPTLYIWRKDAVRRAIPAAISEVTTASAEPVAQVWPYTPPTPPPQSIPEPKEDKSPLSIEDLQTTKKLEQVTTDVKIDVYKAKNEPSIITVDDLARKRDEKKLADEQQLRNLLAENKNLENQIEGVKTRIQALAGVDTSQLQTQLENLAKQKDELSSQMNTLQNQPAPPPPPAAPATPAVIKVVEKSVTRQTTISLTDVPNVINGIVTNDQGVPLDGTILIVKDKGGNSIRALKSNQIGQFIASTPLDNGTYYLEFERKGYTFDILEITLDGKNISPLEIHGHN